MMLACSWSVCKQALELKAFEPMLMMLACFVVRGQKAFELMLVMLACLWSVGRRLSS